MTQKMRVPFSNLRFENWQNLVLVSLFIFYGAQFGFMIIKDRFLLGYGMDYLAFWSAGKIADNNGYAEIYDLENLRRLQTQVAETQGVLEKSEESIISPFPAPIFSIFIVPFQFLSRIPPKPGYWLWTIFNLAILIGYTIFFLQKTLPVNYPLSSIRQMLFTMFLSFPLFMSLLEGQVEVFMVCCMGEFIRRALNQEQLFSGLWLAGLLIKPQLLIIIIPILFIMRNWKVLLGFFISCSLIIGSSLLLSGIKGMKSLIDLWTRFGAGIATSSPERMINWRMVGVNLDSPLGWALAVLGMALTILSIYILTKKDSPFGRRHWVVIMLGIFSATLALTWHSHYHMAVVLIPLLIYCCFSDMISEKVLFFWAASTPLIMIAMSIIALIGFITTRTDLGFGRQWLTGFSGFLLNLLILISAIEYIHRQNKTLKTTKQENPLIE